MTSRKKLHPRSLSLTEMCVLYSLVKKPMKFTGDSLVDLVNQLYRSDITNFNKVYKIVYGVENDNEELVACILLKFGLEYCKLLDFVFIISRQVTP